MGGWTSELETQVGVFGSVEIAVAGNEYQLLPLYHIAGTGLGGPCDLLFNPFDSCVLSVVIIFPL